MKAPVLIIVGDDDEVQFSHLLVMYDALPNAELAVVPRSTHGLITEKPVILARFARDLHRSDQQTASPLCEGHDCGSTYQPPREERHR